MKKLSLAAVLTGIGLLVSGAPVGAHHSFAAEYDAAKPVTLKGVVSKIEWTNPHARFYIDVKDETGTHTWNLELASPNVLSRNGWTRQVAQHRRRNHGRRARWRRTARRWRTPAS